MPPLGNILKKPMLAYPSPITHPKRRGINKIGPKCDLMTNKSMYKREVGENNLFSDLLSNYLTKDRENLFGGVLKHNPSKNP